MSGIMNMFVATKTTIATAVDAFFNSVSLLLNTSSTNGAQNNTFLDSSTNNFTITRNGNTTQGTFTPFSQTGWSNYFGSSNYLTTPSSSAFNLSSGDWTIEGWFWLGSNSGDTRLFTVVNSSTDMYGAIVRSGTIRFGQLGVGEAAFGTINLNTWNHIAFSKTSTSTITCYINGTSTGTTTSYTLPNANCSIYIAASPANYALATTDGYISNFRIVKGTAVYSGSTITVPTTPLTAITNTSLLTCQSNSFIDNSTNAFAITTSGTPSVQAFSPFLPTAAYDTAVVGGSGYFDGTGDYLTTTSGTSLGSGSFTIEAWVYLTAAVGSETTVGSSTNYYTSGFNGNFVFRIGSSNLWQSFDGQGSAEGISGSYTWETNTWTHVAWVRSGSTLTVYKNGVSIASGTVSKTLSDSANGYSIGAGKTNGTANQSPMTGYISGLRTVVGTAVYTAAFTPPTAPPTAITNTALLLNYTNAGIYDSASKNVLETVGNAQVSTTQAKWGTTSMYFDGTGDWLLTPNGKNYINGTEPFTIEFWVYLPSTPNYWTISGGGSGSLLLTIQNLTTININPYGSGNTLSVTTSLSANTWVHIAATRNSANRFDIWVNGVSAGNSTSAQSFGSPTYYVVGAADSGGLQNMTGYLDDFRISKFCRYTTTFTPPTAAFPLQ